MNQSILFPDIQSWDETCQIVTFPAQSQGALIECIVTKDYLETLSGSTLTNEDDVINVFTQFRFDLEEQAEMSIEEEAFSPQGKILLGE